jgi:hypothetical protein
MERILRIRETALTPTSMSKYKFSSSELSSSFGQRASSFVVTPIQAQHALEYYALDPTERTAALYEKGCAPIAETVTNLYQSLVQDCSWSNRSRQLFEAINCGNIVKFNQVQGRPMTSDLFRQGRQVKVRSEHLINIEVRANAKLYWDHERELHAHSMSNSVRYTSADPGRFLEYERRFMEAAEDDHMGSVGVTVRKLVGGTAVQEVVRPVQHFVLESSFQYSMIQALYEVCVWQFSVQVKPVTDWLAATDKHDFAKRLAEKMTKKLVLVEGLSQIQLMDYPTSTDNSMQDEHAKRAPKQPSRFERFWAAQKAAGGGVTKKDAKVTFDGLSTEEKNKWAKPQKPVKQVVEVVQEEDPYTYVSDMKAGAEEEQEDPLSEEDDDDADYDLSNPDDGDGPESPAPAVVSPIRMAPIKKRKLVPDSSKPSPVRPIKMQKLIGKELVHELTENGKGQFLWQLFSSNMAGMIEAKRAFTPIEKTPFESAHAEWMKIEGASDEERFRAAKKELIKTPGILHCFQLFNLMFANEATCPEPEPEDELLFG